MDINSVFSNFKDVFSKLKGEEESAEEYYVSVVKKVKNLELIIAATAGIILLLRLFFFGRGSSLKVVFKVLFNIFFFLTIVIGIVTIIVLVKHDKKKRVERAEEEKKEAAWNAEIQRLSTMTPEERAKEIDNSSAEIWTALSQTEREEKRKYVENAIKTQKEEAERKAKAAKEEAERKAKAAKEEAERKAEEQRKAEEEFKLKVNMIRSMGEGTPVADLTDDECYVYNLIKEHISDFNAPASVRLVKAYRVNYVGSVTESPLKSDYAVEISASNRGGGISKAIYGERSSGLYDITEYYTLYRCYERPSVNVGRVNKAIMYYIKEQGWA